MFISLEEVKEQASKICEDYHLPISVFLADCFVDKQLQERLCKAGNKLERFVCNEYCDYVTHDLDEIYKNYYKTHNYDKFVEDYAKKKEEDAILLYNKINELNLRKYDVA